MRTIKGFSTKRLWGSVFVLMGLFLAVTALPAAAQSRWEIPPVPAVLALAKDGFLVTVAPTAFTPCTSGSFAEEFGGEWLEGLPDVDVFAIFSVLDEGAPTWTLHWVSTPPGAQNISWTTNTWIRVFEVDENDLALFKADPCSFYGNHDFIAEGLGHLNLHSPDDFLNGPGTNSWGWVLKGDLDNHGYCADGKSPRLFWLQDWITHSTDLSTAQTKASKGPTLICK